MGSIEERLLRIQAFKNRMVSVLLQRGKNDEEEEDQEYSQDEILYLLGVNESKARWKSEPLGLVDTAEKSTVYVPRLKCKELRNKHAGLPNGDYALETISEEE